MEKRCKVCGLPESYTGVHFDEKGVCNYCNFYFEHKETLENKEKLEEIFLEKIEAAKKKARETGAKYDCLVGFSGGKDSTYLIYQLKNKYGLRVLAFTFDNGFTTEYGRKNIENALQKVHVDHITVSLNDIKLRKQYSMSVKFLHNFCAVCFHNMHYHCYQIAGQYNIPLILNGRTKGQMWQQADHTTLLEPFETSHSLLEFERQMFHGLEQKLHKSGKVDFLDGVQAEALSYFAYHDISEEEVMNFLVEKIAWTRPIGASAHNDCFAHCIAENMSIKKKGFPVRMGELAVEVRRGNMTLEEMDQELAKDTANFTSIDEKEMERFQNRIKVPEKNNKN